MDLMTWSPTRLRPRPPPLWLVSDGRVTVGPVNTTLLVRGVKSERIDEQCHVRDVRSRIWRALDHVREVRALKEQASRRRSGSTTDVALETLLRLSDDQRESLHLGLGVAARRLRAQVGFVHCFEPQRPAPVTRFAYGLGAQGRIGDPLPQSDLLARVALARCVAMGEPTSDRAFRNAAGRLACRIHEVRGVAMVPILGRHGVIAMLELGRTDHPFRAADGVVLREVARTVADRIASQHV